MKQRKSLTEIRRCLTERLGQPYYTDRFCALFCVDSLVAQRMLPANLIDLVITSPPYNIGKEYESVLSVEEYVSWTKRWTHETCRLLSENGSLLLNLGYVCVESKGRAVPLPYLLWNEIPLYLNQEIVWNYSAGVACKNYLSPRNEKILWYVKDRNNYIFNLDDIRDKNIKYPNSKKNGKLRVNTLGKNPSDVWEIAKVTTGQNRSSAERTPHPCQFPMDLVNRLVLGFSSQNGIILDPFAGSGTTILSGIKYGRFCIGFEIREDYCEIAKKRILNNYTQTLQFPFSSEKETLLCPRMTTPASMNGEE
ncbi:MAG: site-specific DNA-methyltransferase [Planctomycetaceae bacterium]|nr:site-specific DNA-methyltransferase [Planctomycetaceae bacterium]